MVDLSKFAEFHGNLNGNNFNIDTQLQVIINVKIIIFKCTFKEVHYTNRALRHVATALFSPYNLRSVGTLSKKMVFFFLVMTMTDFFQINAIVAGRQLRVKFDTSWYV